MLHFNNLVVKASGPIVEKTKEETKEQYNHEEDFIIRYERGKRASQEPKRILTRKPLKEVLEELKKYEAIVNESVLKGIPH